MGNMNDRVFIAANPGFFLRLFLRFANAVRDFWIRRELGKCE